MKLARSYATIRRACVGVALPLTHGKQTQYHMFGSGVCVDPSGIVVTAKHVLEGEFPPGEREADGTYAVPSVGFVVTFVHRAANRFELIQAVPQFCQLLDDHDLALIQLRPREGGWPAARLGDAAKLREGDELGIAGYPLRGPTNPSATPQLFSGIVSQLVGHFVAGEWQLESLVADASVHPGNSGGPVFDRKAEIVAVVSSQLLRELDLVGIRTTELAESGVEEHGVWTNITHCVPSTVIGSAVDGFRRRMLRQASTEGS